MNAKIKKTILFVVRYKVLILSAIAALAVAVIMSNVVSCTRHSSLSLDTDDKIDITPEQIRSVAAIGEWEFLSVSDEEFVDTVRKGFISEDKLARIYVGTLRLGVDMHRVKPGWLSVKHDTLKAVLPNIQLLDHRFIDEANTRSFFESGSWSAADRESLYQRAYNQMIARCMTPENLKTAEQNARVQFEKLFVSMGYRQINITFDGKK